MPRRHVRVPREPVDVEWLVELPVHPVPDEPQDSEVTQPLVTSRERWFRGRHAPIVHP